MKNDALNPRGGYSIGIGVLMKLEGTDARLLSSVVGSFSMIVCTYPLDTLRVRVQTNLNSSSHLPIKQSTRSIALQIVHNEGFRSLYRGVGTSLMAAVPAFSIMYMCNNLLVDALIKRYSVEELPFSSRILCGIGTGFISTTLCSPMGLLIVQRQVRINAGSRLSLPKHFMSLIVEGGIRSLWKGLSLTLMRDVPGQTIFFTSKHYLQFYLTLYYASF